VPRAVEPGKLDLSDGDADGKAVDVAKFSGKI
jgi:hypothetical protein